MNQSGWSKNSPWQQNNQKQSSYQGSGFNQPNNNYSNYNQQPKYNQSGWGSPGNIQAPIPFGGGGNYQHSNMSGKFFNNSETIAKAQKNAGTTKKHL